MRVLTPRDKSAMEAFYQVTGSELRHLDRYLSGEWEWVELWDDNFSRIDPSQLDCVCRFAALRASGRRVGYPLSISRLEQEGCSFELVSGGGSWYVDAYYRCGCGQLWKEVFVEAMQYNGNHAYPVADEDCPA